jgi:hypothetical protein
VDVILFWKKMFFDERRSSKLQKEKIFVAYLTTFHVLIIFKAIYNNKKEKREQFNEKKIRT